MVPRPAHWSAALPTRQPPPWTKTLIGAPPLGGRGRGKYRALHARSARRRCAAARQARRGCAPLRGSDPRQHEVAVRRVDQLIVGVVERLLIHVAPDQRAARLCFFLHQQSLAPLPLVGRGGGGGREVLTRSSTHACASRPPTLPSPTRGEGFHPKFSSLKKSFPLSSITMKAGKSTTSIRQIASMPSSGYSTHSTFLMQCSARLAAAPPIEAR